jgi:hypothetical protein
MGLSIHYSGNIANPELLPELIDEVRDIATVYNWEYKEYEREFPKDSVGQAEYNQYIYGISFTPPQCETISICFLSNGRMSSNAHLLFFGKTDEQPERDYLYMLSVKTQFASVELHQFTIQLFRYLNKKYFANFELSDDGSYWETNDIELLKTNFKRNANLINSVSSAIEAIPMLPDETIEAYFERLMKFIRNRNEY